MEEQRKFDHSKRRKEKSAWGLKQILKINKTK